MSDLYYVKPVDNSRWAPPPNWREPRAYAMLFLVSAVLLGAGLLFARERFQSRDYGYQIERLERQRLRLVENNRKLRLEEASLGDPLRIDSIARSQLGMTTLAPHQIYRGEPVASGAAVVAEQRPEPALLAPQSRSVAAALP